MKMFGKSIVLDEDIDLLDTEESPLVSLEDSSRSQASALSEDSDKARKDKADKAWRDKAGLEGRKTILCDVFWEDFVLLSKVCLLRDEDADLYDVFETIRTKFLGGWGYTAAFLAKMDAEINREELANGYRPS